MRVRLSLWSVSVRGSLNAVTEALWALVVPLRLRTTITVNVSIWRSSRRLFMTSASVLTRNKLPSSSVSLIETVVAKSIMMNSSGVFAEA